jgi:sugar lactone lactonase YvrE
MVRKPHRYVHVLTRCLPGWCVARIDPGTGQILRKIMFPVSKVSSCCFGGPNYEDLYVSTAAKNTDLKEQPLAGSLFVVRNVGVRGLPAVPYAG